MIKIRNKLFARKKSQHNKCQKALRIYLGTEYHVILRKVNKYFSESFEVNKMNQENIDIY